MPTPAKGPRMGGSPAHERLMLANLATALFEHGRITTTEAKAKRLRPYAEHLITFGKRGDLHARRQVLKRLNDKSVVHTLFAEIGPRYADRPGGYTRILKLGNRKGDNAPMAIIELVEGQTVSQQAVGEAERARGSKIAPKKAPTGATRESAEALAKESPTAAAVVAESVSYEPPSGEESVEAATAVETDVEVSSAAVEAEPPAADAPAAEAPAAEAPAADAPADEAAAPETVVEVQEANAELVEAQDDLSEAEQELADAKTQLAEAEAAKAVDEPAEGESK